MDGDPQAQQTFTTDEIIEVFDHLKNRPEPWGQIWCEHGMEPKYASRALSAIFPGTVEELRQFGAAFALGLQFGAMRLAPIEYVEDEPVDNCQCFICQLRRTAEAQAREEGGDDAEGGGVE